MRTCSIEECDSKHYAKSYCELHYVRFRRWGDPFKVGVKPYEQCSNGSIEVRRKRLLGKIIRNDGGCWVWTGTTTAAGYGQMSVLGRRQYTHRISYELFVGAIPEGLSIDHLCRVRACCNPEHLEAVTHAVNVGRGERPTRTHCLHGHELSGYNLVIAKKGRLCRQCGLDSQKRRRDRDRMLTDVEN
jgi:hypothetical protein